MENLKKNFFNSALLFIMNYDREEQVNKQRNKAAEKNYVPTAFVKENLAAQSYFSLTLFLYLC